VARKLVQARREQPITTTRQLAQLVRSALGTRGDASGIDPATRTFQALRIAVNDEIGALEAFLAEVDRGARSAASGSPTWLSPGARIAMISFHSLEDRPVKRTFASIVEEGAARSLTPSPVRAGEDEVRVNPRSRSARLRAVRLVGGVTG
jgi:16S rRNA (cytosine1402-N4)-methyltransferase